MIVNNKITIRYKSSLRARSGIIKKKGHTKIFKRETTTDGNKWHQLSLGVTSVYLRQTYHFEY